MWGVNMKRHIWCMPGWHTLTNLVCLVKSIWCGVRLSPCGRSWSDVSTNVFPLMCLISAVWCCVWPGKGLAMVVILGVFVQQTRYWQGTLLTHFCVVCVC
jgi:hypothetical protein